MNRVLVIRVGRIGDMVMITPALRAILNKHPDSEICLLTSPEGRHVLRGFDPRLGEPLVYNRRGLMHSFRRWRLRRTLAAGGFSRIYCLETKASYHRLIQDLPGEQYILGPVERVTPYPERCLRLVEPNSPPGSWVSLPLTASGRAAARAMFARDGIGEADFVVGLHPSFSTLAKLPFRGRVARRRKAWPIASFARVAELLAEYAQQHQLNLRVVSVLLPADRKLGLDLVERSNGIVRLFTDEPDFERYKAAIARMNLLICPDTGPMHMAAALGTPLVALFSGNHPRDCGPYTDPARYVVLRAEESEHPELGLAAISPESVFAAATTFLPDARRNDERALGRASRTRP